MRRVTLWPGPAVTVNCPLRSPLVNPFTQRLSQLTVMLWAGVAHTCTEMLLGWEISPCTEHDTKSPSVVQLPMLSTCPVLAAFPAVACAAVIPAPATSAAVPAVMAIRFITWVSPSQPCLQRTQHRQHQRVDHLAAYGLPDCDDRLHAMP